MRVPLPVVTSLDTVVLIARACCIAAFLGMLISLKAAGQCSSPFALSAYGVNVFLSDHTRVSADYRGADVSRVRIEISPSLCDFAQLAWLLAQVSDIRLQRVDVALDYVGYDIQEYEFHATRLGQARHLLARYAHPHSYSFGAGDSHRRIAVYDKVEKCRADGLAGLRIVDVHGEVHLVSLRQLAAEGLGWFRIEIRSKGSWILEGSVPKPHVFDDFIAKQRGEVSLGLDFRTAATLDYICRNPEAIRRLGRNSRPKYRRFLKELRDEHGLTPDPADVYRSEYGAMCSALERILSLGEPTDGGCL